MDVQLQKLTARHAGVARHSRAGARAKQLRRSALPAALALLFAAAWALPAQTPFYDPLTRSEADQVRHTSEQWNKRPPLLLHFARERLDRFQKLRAATPPPPARGPRLYSLLRQYHAIVSEADDAVDDLYSARARYKSTPKVLRQAIAREQALQSELQAIRAASSPADLAIYRFELEDCLDITGDSLQNARDDLAKLKAKH
jgi:hypothetical protein